MAGEIEENTANAVTTSATPPAGLTRREIREWERQHNNQAITAEEVLALQADRQLSAYAPTPVLGSEVTEAEDVSSVTPEVVGTEFATRREIRSSEKSGVSPDSYIAAEAVTSNEVMETVVQEEVTTTADQPNIAAASEVAEEARTESDSLQKELPAPGEKMAAPRVRPHTLLRSYAKKPASFASIKSKLDLTDRQRRRQLTQRIVSAGVLLVCFAFALSASIPANALLTQSDIEQIKMQAFLDEQVSLVNQSVVVGGDGVTTNTASRDGVDVTLASKPVSPTFYGSSGLCGEETEMNPPSSGGSIIWPLANNKISSPYGYRWGSLHAGIDFEGPTGTPIMSVADGIVKAAFPSAGNSLGICAIISHNVNGVKFDTLYGHMSSLGVGVGQTVSGGQVIGTVGSTGNSTGSHLHYEVHVNGIQIDPAPFMANYAGAPG